MTATERFALAAHKAGMPRDQVENFISAGYVPQPRQMDFHAACRACDEPEGPVEVGFGGARGPGKSHALYAQIILDDCQRVPGLKCLILRKVGKAVRESFEDIRGKILPFVAHKYNRSDGIVYFPNGSRVIFGHFENESDIDAYLGLEYDVVGVEECTTLTSSKYRAIRTCNRTSKPDWRPRVYTNTNPGGVGHTWYKSRFVAPYRAGNETATRFVPATVRDNIFVNAEYRATLEDQVGWRREAWLNGSWDVMAGQYFTTFDAERHIELAFKVPSHWPYKWLALDYGWTHPTAAVLLALDHEFRLHVIEEYALSKTTVAMHLQALESILGRHGLSPADLYTVVGGGDMWQKDRNGTCVAEEYLVAFPKLEMAKMDRIAGAHEILDLLDNDRLIFAHTCHRTIEQLCAMEHDPHRPEDVLKVDVDENGDGGDDLYDALRYGVMVHEDFKVKKSKVQVFG